MRGIGCTLSRLNAARAFVAGAALLAGAAAATAYAQSAPETAPETAMAVPRTAPPNGAEVALPQPLDPSQAARVRHIFQLQDRGRIAEAERATSALSDQTLLGSILADRYLGPYTVSTAAELEDWLNRFGHQAPAPEIYALLRRKLPRGAKLPPAPNVTGLPAPVVLSGPPPSLDDPVAAETDGVSSFAVAVADRAGAGETRSALAMIRGIRGLTTAHTGALKAIVARALFVANHDEEALSLASAAYDAAGGEDGASAYIAGLAAWRLGRLADAGRFFRASATARDAEPPLIAAGAFWAARTALYLRQPKQWLPWMERASAETGTFYGLLAGRMLGLGPDLGGPGSGAGTATLGEADVDAVAATAAGWRAFALIEVGEPALAEAELATLWPRIENDRTFGRSVMLVAAHAGLPGLTARLSELISVGPGQELAGVPAVPMPTLSPAGGFTIDPALVYALTRLESNFDAGAVSRDGARGLMQLMPVAAAAAVGHWGSPLDDPGVNLELGQRYMRYLAGQSGVNDDLLYVLGSYNGGPGAFAGWARTIQDGGDPLLFIESIPNGQTRHFVESGLAYTWIYAMRLGLPEPSLDALAQGNFPHFTAEANTGGMAEASLALH